MEEFVKFAIAKGVIKYGFSSHAPLPFHTSWNMNMDDYPYYVKEFFRLKEKYAATSVSVPRVNPLKSSL